MLSLTSLRRTLHRGTVLWLVNCISSQTSTDIDQVVIYNWASVMFFLRLSLFYFFVTTCGAFVVYWGYGNDYDYSVSLSSDSSLIFWLATLPLSRGSPLSSRVLAEKTIPMYLLTNFAILGSAGQKSVNILSWLLRFKNSGLMAEILPYRQFLFTLVMLINDYCNT